MISLGNVRGLSNHHPPLYEPDAGSANGEGTIAAFSHRQYNFMPYERHSVCLPGPGTYTFSIFDWAGNGLAASTDSAAKYALYTHEGRPILSGSNFAYLQTTVFELPLPPLESEAPSVSPAPSVSSSPTVDCDWIDVEILHDMYPEETTWSVCRVGRLVCRSLRLFV